MPDHIHLLMSIPSKISVSNFMEYLKGENAMMIFGRHSSLKCRLEIDISWHMGIM